MTNVITTRDPSTPLPGGARIGVDAALATILVWVAGMYVPATIMPPVQVLIIAAVAGVLGGIGKMARDAGSVFGKVF